MGSRRIIILNWRQQRLSLLHELEARFVMTHPVDGLELVTVGRQRLASPTRINFERETTSHRHLTGVVETHGLEDFKALLVKDADIAGASAVILLPDLEAAEPDAYTSLIVRAIRAIGVARAPNVIAEILDPEAADEFAHLRVSTILQPGLLGSLLAHGCIELKAFDFLLALLDGRIRVAVVPIPDPLRQQTFQDACWEMEEDETGQPITLLGLQNPITATDEPPFDINPTPDSPLQSAAGLIAIVGETPLTLRRPE